MDTYQYGEYTFVIKPITIGENELFHLSVRPCMSDEDYDNIKYRLERLHGHWRERFGGFIFDENPINKLNLPETWAPIVHSDYELWCINRQFYPTPADLAEHVVELAEISETHTVLEPSAGRGALLKPLKRTEGITAIEIDEGLTEALRGQGYKVINKSFEDAMDDNDLTFFDRIIMNPPFSQQRDIKHILYAYNLLKTDGILVAIMSENDLYYDTPLTRFFNEFLKGKEAYIEEVPMRSFKESETNIDTVIIKIKKKSK